MLNVPKCIKRKKSNDKGKVVPTGKAPHQWQVWVQKSGSAERH
jgi:hypothetical protein